MLASVSLTASALTLFPAWDSMGPWYRAEVEGLSDAQLDFDSQAPAQEWMWWSIRRQTSHVAAMLFRWLFMRWGDALWEGTAPLVDDLAGVLNIPQDWRHDEPRLTPHLYWEIDAILARLHEGVALTQEALRRHTVAQARHKTITVPASPILLRLQPAHPQGFAPSPTDPTRWTLTLEGTVRHMYFEAVTHLYNIQRLKRAQGLPVCVDLPRVGYYVLPGWDNDLS
jgi:hypothetical protein